MCCVKLGCTLFSAGTGVCVINNTCINRRSRIEMSGLSYNTTDITPPGTCERASSSLKLSVLSAGEKDFRKLVVNRAR